MEHTTQTAGQQYFPNIRQQKQLETMKRILDLVITILMFILLLPLMLLCAMLVRLSSPGPVFFRQQRLGLSGHPFSIVKFRTMMHNAPPMRCSDGSAYTGADDPRITGIGRFLRKTSLDELPQLWNVLRGEMSIVGPRPDQVDQLQYYTAAEKAKLRVKPGLTGLAQINGRNGIPWQARKALDVDYVNRQSLALDVLILVKTIPYVLFRSGVSAQ